MYIHVVNYMWEQLSPSVYTHTCVCVCIARQQCGNSSLLKPVYVVNYMYEQLCI